MSGVLLFWWSCGVNSLGDYENILLIALLTLLDIPNPIPGTNAGHNKDTHRRHRFKPASLGLGPRSVTLLILEIRRKKTQSKTSKSLKCPCKAERDV